MVLKSKSKTIEKKRVKNVQSSQNSSISRKDFETFQIGVERLKELKEELDSLNTQGFNSEEKEIRFKLKNVSEVPNIERAIKTLRLKINNKYKPKRKSSNAKKILDEGLDEIKEEISKLKRSKEKNFGEIKKEISSLKESKKNKPTFSLDPNISILVDSNFNQFVSQTKKALSNRIQNKEKEMNKVLELDLKKKELKYKQKHDALLLDFAEKRKKLENDYKNKYNEKVELNLHKDVSDKLNKILQEKMAKEKSKLSRIYGLQLRAHAKEEIERRKKSLEKSFEKSKKKLQASLNKNKEAFEKKSKILSEALQKHEEELDNKTKLARKSLQASSEKDKKFLQESLSKDREALQKHKQELDNKNQLARKSLQASLIKNQASGKRKKELTESLEKERGLLQKSLSKDREAFEKKSKILREALQKQKQEMHKKMVEDLSMKLQKEIARKEVVLRRDLSREYELNLKKKVQEHESELNKKKLDLEFEMQNKIKQILE